MGCPRLGAAAEPGARELETEGRTAGASGARTPGRWLHCGRGPLPARPGEGQRLRGPGCAAPSAARRTTGPRDTDFLHVSPSSWAGLAVVGR